MLWQKALRGLTLRPRLLAACLRVLLQGTMNFMTGVDYGADTLCIVLRTTQIACDSVPATEMYSLQVTMSNTRTSTSSCDMRLVYICQIQMSLGSEPNPSARTCGRESSKVLDTRGYSCFAGCYMNHGFSFRPRAVAMRRPSSTPQSRTRANLRYVSNQSVECSKSLKATTIPIESSYKDLHDRRHVSSITASSICLDSSSMTPSSEWQTAFLSNCLQGPLRST